jgi:protoporphyrinogen oxidase
LIITNYPVVVIGAGPAGLTSAYGLARQGLPPLVLERSGRVGGIARTEEYRGYRFDIGGHRFYTKVEQVETLWSDMLNGDLRKTPRLSRIYHRGRFFAYPLQMRDALQKLGVAESALVVLSYLKARVFPTPVEESFEQWVTNRFGQRAYKTFFQGYTEKVWGIPCTAIRADWAAQRIKGLSVWSVIKHALGSKGDIKTLIDEFDYPRLGPGMMWDRFRDAVEAGGGQVALHADVTSIEREGNHIKSVQVRHNGQAQKIIADQFISSMSVQDLILRMRPAAPDAVLEAARRLHYRAFILVGVILDQPKLFPDNWIYVHSPDVKVGRIQNYRNWSPDLVPDAGKTSLGMEYFCEEGDEMWETPDAELIALAARELDYLRLADSGKLEDGVVFRQSAAYPVYDAEYRANLDVIRRYLATIDNLQTIGRNGTHHYNNMDHSMLTGMLAARNVMGEHHDLWDVNTDQSYGEEIEAECRVVAAQQPRMAA